MLLLRATIGFKKTTFPPQQKKHRDLLRARKDTKPRPFPQADNAADNNDDDENGISYK